MRGNGISRGLESATSVVLLATTALVSSGFWERAAAQQTGLMASDDYVHQANSRVADGQAAVKSCDYDNWGIAKAAYDYDAKEALDAASKFGSRTVYDNVLRETKKFPTYPFPCAPKQAAKKPKIPNFRIAENETPRPQDRVFFSHSYFYVAGAVGGANNCTNQNFTQIITIGGADAFDPTRRNNCAGQFVGGGAFGFSVPFTDMVSLNGTVNPEYWEFIRRMRELRIGGEVQVLGASGGTSTFQGTPTTLLGTPPGTDTYTARDNYFVVVNATATMPIAPSVSLIGHAGYAWANKTVTYNCNGLCTLAGTPQSSTSKDVTVGGPAVGGGLQIAAPQFGFPVLVQFDYNHLFLNQQTVEFGAPGTVFVNSKVGQDVDLFTARVVIPIAPIGDFLSGGSGFKSRYTESPITLGNKYEWGH